MAKRKPKKQLDLGDAVVEEVAEKIVGHVVESQLGGLPVEPEYLEAFEEVSEVQGIAGGVHQGIGMGTVEAEQRNQEAEAEPGEVKMPKAFQERSYLAELEQSRRAPQIEADDDYPMGRMGR